MAPDPPRPVTDLSGQQAGDQSFQAAGENIYHGANADHVLDFLREYVFAADQRRETAVKAASQELKRAQLEMGIVSDAVRSVRDRLDDDDRDRVRRQRDLDHTLATLGEYLEAQALDLAALRRGQTLARRWLAGLTALLIIEILVVAWLVDRELAILAARAAYDVLVAGRR